MNFMSAQVEITVDDSKLSTQLAKAKKLVVNTVDKIENSFKKMGSVFKGVFDKMIHYAKLAGVAIIGAFALVTRAAMKQEDAINRLNITLKATGYAAGFTAAQLLDQAKALQQVTRFGDETITAMQTMLLTFKNIKGDEFKRATEAALDMATAEAAVSGRAVDLTATSIRLGKALNDPILGISALSRVGVQFTEQQKNLIKTLVLTGKTAEAQQVILTELEGEFGGMARDVNTASGALKQMWNALGDVAERIGQAFLPGIKDTARAIKEWAERNEERIGRWANMTAAYLTYAKDVLVTFVKFLASDWSAGIKVGLDVSLEFFKAFGTSLVILITDIASRAWRAFVKEFGEGLGKWLAEAGKPEGVFGKLSLAIPAVGAARIGMMKAGVGLVESSRAAAAPTGPTTSEKLKAVWQQTGLNVQNIIPSELKMELEDPLKKLESNLEGIGMAAEQVEGPMKEALVEVPKEANKMLEDARSKMQNWALDATNMWGNLSSIAIGALDSISDTLAEFVVKGKADFNSLADSILMDLTRMMTKALIAQSLGFLFPGTFGAGGGAGLGMAAVQAIPGLQEGGEVTQTGIAKIHKGERFSGVDSSGKPLSQSGGNNVNINVTAVDAAGTFQFLDKNKKTIASLLQGTLSSNHPLRRSKSWKS